MAGASAAEMPAAAETGAGLTPAVELRAVTAARDGRPVWSGANVRIEEGEFVAVLGPNGSGKSTLLDLLLGLLAPVDGSVSVLGAAPGVHGGAIGYLPQRHAFDSTTRIRGVDIVRLGLDGARFGLPLDRKSVV